MDPTRWAHAVIMWDPYVGTRRQGDQDADTFTIGAGIQWSRRARNRKEWTELGFFFFKV
jgi:hypothetical protein